MDAIIRDARDAVRQWGRSPVVTAAALVSLKLGIGATTAFVSLVDAVQFRMLPVREPERLVKLVLTRGDATFQLPVWEYIRDAQPVLADVAAMATDRLHVVRDGESRFAELHFVSGGFFDAFGVPLALGRPLAPSDDVPGAAPVGVVAHAFWRQELGARVEAIGETIEIEGHAIEVVGVTGRVFSGIDVGRRVEVLLPLSLRATLQDAAGQRDRPISSGLHVFGRLRSGQTAAEAANAVRRWQPILRTATVGPDASVDQHLPDPFDLAPAATGISALRRHFGESLTSLLWAVGFVLIIACANLSALQLARFSDRRHEMRVRRALGATRITLVRQLLVESLLLSGLGAVLGTGFALWLNNLVIPTLVDPLDKGAEPYLVIGVDWRVASAAALLMVVTALGTALLPAMQAAGQSAPAGDRC